MAEDIRLTIIVNHDTCTTTEVDHVAGTISEAVEVTEADWERLWARYVARHGDDRCDRSRA